MRSILAAVLLITGGCASVPKEVTLPKQAPLFSLTVTEGAFSGPVLATTGWLFFVEDSAPIKGPYFIGYYLDHGKVRELLSTGSSSADVLAAIESVDLEPFDWKTELAAAKVRLESSLKGKEDAIAEPFTLDGAEWEITMRTNRGLFTMREWNPGPIINYYAKYSEKIAKLKRVLDTLALYEGHHKLGI